jgi:hypothetical protein
MSQPPSKSRAERPNSAPARRGAGRPPSFSVFCTRAVTTPIVTQPTAARPMKVAHANRSPANVMKCMTTSSTHQAGLRNWSGPIILPAQLGRLELRANTGSLESLVTPRAGQAEEPDEALVLANSRLATRHPSGWEVDQLSSAGTSRIGRSESRQHDHATQVDRNLKAIFRTAATAAICRRRRMLPLKVSVLRRLPERPREASVASSQ